MEISRFQSKLTPIAAATPFYYEYSLGCSNNRQIRSILTKQAKAKSHPIYRN